MGFLNKFGGSKEDAPNKTTIVQVRGSLNGLFASESKEIRDLFGKILDVAEQSLRGVLFIAPEEFGFKKMLTKEEIDFWFRRVSLALVAYSYCFFYVEEQSPSAQYSFNKFWQRMLDSYNKIFNENVTIDVVDHYAAGMIEESKKKFSKSGNEKQALRLMLKDYTTLAGELLEKIWHENVNQKALDDLQNHKPGENTRAYDLTAQKIVLLGRGIWETHLEIVAPFLPNLMTEYKI
ncbi:MAG: hypothetical protein A3A80_03000 [Candidatus Terrybacteria bacterium RIFCSPLOWO2_01_FULL_44_24]|uniref:Uncharacterized protein n=1 Tax=Candidatus Terrybacteria bacterium RIFCSPHIGHO2_01_FULL_43_35 TaxID=1802361 RepID=A0A1G2PH04_9BACT|nr:MAG: hypothetical protein A2828_03185 [Candidatus Terrybacteria bacterium RIFCSPHIGHO2_01_FULL_43_35]OHA50111.1 MAG: hypothetical protein A3B75_01195 [Candidatus Terrybacteria bacterium RIFCSPHIGHO2_02_FULL_43_14]OHA51032.1 MAG: hypothetical protein A3A80_03000 [Candidatus Terrybacteria bacterium RIFCSPLOWO2_01_FULL_44_24]